MLDASAAGTAAFGLYVGQEYSNSGGREKPLESMD